MKSGVTLQQMLTEVKRQSESNISVLPSLHNINILQFGAVLIMESA